MVPWGPSPTTSPIVRVYTERCSAGSEGGLLRSVMRFRPLSFVLITLLSQPVFAQSPVQSEAYTLHAKEERGNGFSLSGQVALPGSAILLDQEHSLLVLIPQGDGAWVLKRLRSWDTKAPTEDTLEIAGEPGKGTDVFIQTDLNLTSDGRYLLVRINYRSGGIGATERNRAAVITMIDMKRFAVLSRQTTTNPLLADSQWAFDEHNDLVTTRLEKRLTETEPSYRMVTDHYSAAALEMPTLIARDPCEYDSVMKLSTDATGWTKPTVVHATDGCAALVARAHVDSVQALPGQQKADLLKVALGCNEVDSDHKLGLTLADCREGKSHADGLFVTTSRHTANVFSTTSKQEILTIPLSHDGKGVTGLLASVNSGNYVILVKRGIHIEVYRLPG